MPTQTDDGSLSATKQGVHARQLSSNSDGLPAKLTAVKEDENDDEDSWGLSDDDDDVKIEPKEPKTFKLPAQANHSHTHSISRYKDDDDDELDIGDEELVVKVHAKSDTEADDEADAWPDEDEIETPKHQKQTSFSDSEIQEEETENGEKITKRIATKKTKRKVRSANATPSPMNYRKDLKTVARNDIRNQTNQFFMANAHRRLPSSLTEQNLPLFLQENNQQQKKRKTVNRHSMAAIGRKTNRISAQYLRVPTPMAQPSPSPSTRFSSSPSPTSADTLPRKPVFINGQWVAYSPVAPTAGYNISPSHSSPSSASSTSHISLPLPSYKTEKTQVIPETLRSSAGDLGNGNITSVHTPEPAKDLKVFKLDEKDKRNMYSAGEEHKKFLSNWGLTDEQYQYAVPDLGLVKNMIIKKIVHDCMTRKT